MEHAQREAALRARDLVVIELHRIDGSAAKFVVLSIRPEDRTKQNASLTRLGVSFYWTGFHRIRCLKDKYSAEHFAVIVVTLQNYYVRSYTRISTPKKL